MVDGRLTEVVEESEDEVFVLSGEVVLEELFSEGTGLFGAETDFCGEELKNRKYAAIPLPVRNRKKTNIPIRMRTHFIFPLLAEAAV
jgi:hypothetical protein